MPEAPIPFGNLLASGQEVLAGAPAASVNVSVDATGTVRRRPGIQTTDIAPVSAIGSGEVDGLHVTPLGKVFAIEKVSGVQRSLYRVSSGAATLLGSIAGPRRPVVSDTEAMIVIANGSFVYKYVLGGTLGLLGGSVPSAVSHVVFSASRLLCNDLALDRSKVNYSSPAAGSVITGHEQWRGDGGTGGFFSAEAQPDPVQAIHAKEEEVFVWGSTTLEIYVPDALQVFARGASRDFGCVAPYSIISYDGTFVWLDARRRVVRSDGRSVEPLSQALDATLDGLSKVSDAFGYRVNEGRSDHLVMNFPSADLTLALQEGGGWAQWAQAQGGQLRAFPVTSHAHDPTTDTNYVGLSDGRVCKLVDGVADDLGDPILAHTESGFQDHGTSRWKENIAVRFTLRRGTYTGTTDAVAFVQWQDRPGAWCAPRPLYLGDSGDTYPVVTLRSTGTYRQRNWRFIFSENADLALVRAEEEFVVTEG